MWRLFDMARKSRKNITDRQIEILNIAQYIRTAEYVRLSVEDNDNKGNSIENQKLILDLDLSDIKLKITQIVSEMIKRIESYENK